MTTETDLRKGFLLGPWEVLPDRGLFRDGARREHVEPLVMRVLVALAVQQGEVLSKDDLINDVWDGRAQNDEPLNRCISILRRKLGDDSRDPTFIQNIPRIGYRLMMPVQLMESPDVEQTHSPRPAGRLWYAVALALIGVIAAIAVSRFVAPTEEQRAIRSVAIYPFACTGNTEEYLCFGFSEALTSTLLQTSKLRIVKFRKPLPQNISYTELAKTLNVDGLLTGGVQQVGGQLRVSAELIDGASGDLLLNPVLDGSTDEVFDLQEQVASVVTNEMFGPDTEPARSLSRPSSFAAFAAYARGQYQFERRSRESIEESIRLFEQTIALDPNFGPAYLGLAYAYLLMPEYDSSLSIQSMYDLAAERAEAGIAADPGIGEVAGTVFGFIHHKRGEWLEADEAFRLAIDGKTVYPLTRHWYSKFLAAVGRLDESLEQARMAYEQAPDNPNMVSRMAIINLWTSDLDAAGRYFEIANDMGQGAPIHDLAYGLYLIGIEDIDEARRFTKTGLENYDLDSSWVDVVYDGLEGPDAHAKSVARVTELEQNSDIDRFIIMTLWAVLGESDRAFATAMSLEGIGQDFETGLELMFSDDLRILREHPNFPQLLDKTGLTEYWSQVGCAWTDEGVRCQYR